MKKIQVLLFVLFLTMGVANAKAMNIESLLDQAVSMQKNGDNSGLTKALTESASMLEEETNDSKGDFKDKLLSSVGGLKGLIPLASKGLVKQNALQKIVSTIKMLLGANRISSLLGSGGSLLGKGVTLGGNLSLMKMGMSALGGGSSSDKIGSLISDAIGSVGNLDSNGLAAKAAEPAIKKQLGGLLDLVKGAI